MKGHRNCKKDKNQQLPFSTGILVNLALYYCIGNAVVRIVPFYAKRPT